MHHNLKQVAAYPRWLPNPYLSLTILSWGYNFVAIKLLYQELNAPSVALGRFAAMYAIMVGVCLAAGQSLRYPTGSALKILINGFLSMGVYMILFVEGLRESTAPEAAIILSTSPILTYLLAVFIRQERFSGWAMVGAVVAYAGVVIVVLGGAELSPARLGGNLLIFASAFVWAVAVVQSKSLVVATNPVRFLTLSMPGGLAALIPYGMAATIAAPWSQLSLPTWLAMAHVILLAGVLGFTCFYKGVEQIGPSGAMIYQYLVPPLTAVFSWLVFRFALTPMQFVGFVVVLGGVIWATRARTLAARRPIPEPVSTAA